MLEEKIKTLFENYINYFVRYDVNGVVNCYDYPCILSTPDKIIVLKSVEEAQQEISQIFSWMKQGNATDIGVVNASYHQFSQNIAVANIHWKFLDNQQQIMAEFSALYHLHVTEEHAKIMQVISHENEISVALEKQLTLLK